MYLGKLPRLFHVGNHFDSPKIFDTVETGKHPNGVLGFWLSPCPEHCRRMGQGVLYEVGLQGKGRRDMLMPLRELRGYHEARKSVDFYVHFRNAFRNNYDVIWIEDHTRAPGEVIVMNLDIITSVNRIDWADIESDIQKRRKAMMTEFSRT